MEANVKQIYQLHIEQLRLSEKLELLELLMQSTFELIREEKVLNKLDEKRSVPEKTEISKKSSDSDLTEFQKHIIDGPVMTDEDYELFKEKKEHFAQWR